MKWLKNPSSVHPSWDIQFRNEGEGVGVYTQDRSLMDKSELTLDFIRRYQVRGHLLADLDPLGLQNRPTPEELGMDPKSSGFDDLEEAIDLTQTQFAEMDNLLLYADQNQDGKTTVAELTETLQEVYASKVGYEYMHIMDRNKCNWIRSKIEAPRDAVPKPERLQILDRLAWASMFEQFCAKKWNATKRFGLEGLTTMIPGLKAAMDTATLHGVDDISFGMPHRGRLNVLANVIRKPLETIFKEFAGTNVPAIEDVEDEDTWVASGDVKYHLGTSYTRTYEDGRELHTALLANPSHLEAADPVTIGRTRARMQMKGDKTGEKCMAILIHGDAAFAGQGVVYETMQLSQLENYQTGGTLHVIANNQVGFTTDPSDARSTKYCTALGLTFQAPIFHVNAGDVEEVTRVFKLATEYRCKFNTDVIVDLIGYRKNGHQELDNPDYTQPLMYQKIKNKERSLGQHISKLIAEKVFTQAEVDEVLSKIETELNESYDRSATHEVAQDEWLANNWEGLSNPNFRSAIQSTGVPTEDLAHIGKHLTVLPEDFSVHRQLGKILKQKANAIEAGAGLDWGTAEALAFGSLLQQGVHVRISGQDVQRGTFSHRHAVLHDQNSHREYMPLNNIPGNGAELVASNSCLSEFGVLGFEMGYSQVDPFFLTIWEAQFGDFVNSAQTIIDQFISAGEDKWLRQSGLVMLLPHGYDGQGPEHSSARLERFLEMCNEDADIVPEMSEDKRMQIQLSNWQVVNCTTPANYFHVLRRQICRKFRKPLVVMSPKALLRLRECQSTMADMEEGTKFMRVIPETHADELLPDDQIRRLCFCSGKIYYELLAARRAAGVKDVAIVRIEQLSPFPFDKVAFQAAKYTNAEIAYVQEEPKNMGAWTFVADRIETATNVLNKNLKLPSYIGRSTMCAPAEGSAKEHAKTQKILINKALS